MLQFCSSASAFLPDFLTTFEKKIYVLKTTLSRFYPPSDRFSSKVENIERGEKNVPMGMYCKTFLGLVFTELMVGHKASYTF